MLQSILRIVMPRQCMLCDDLTEASSGLCPSCWAETTFVRGNGCSACGALVAGDVVEGDLCDECLTNERNWSRGKTVMSYTGAGRKLVLALKHYDRTDLAPKLSQMMATEARDLLSPDTVIVPVPMFWLRSAQRRYNQAALLARGLARQTGHPYVGRALVRRQNTSSTRGLGRAERMTLQTAAIAANPNERHRILARPVLLVDDVMTTGATLFAATEALLGAGATQVCVMTLARGVKDA